MKNIEDIYKKFEKEMKEVADKAVSEVVTEYIPYAETDYQDNVFLKSQSVIENFLADESDELDFTSFFNKDEIRQKIYEDFKEEIENDIIKDQQKEIESLKNRLELLTKVT